MGSEKKPLHTCKIASRTAFLATRSIGCKSRLLLCAASWPRGVRYNPRSRRCWKFTSHLTRSKSISVANHALEALHGRYAVRITGQPGIGKTRVSMVYAIQTFLYSKSALVYFGFKLRILLFFFPTEDDNYHVWRTKSLNFEATRFQDDAQVADFIDAPDEGPYCSMVEFRPLNFVSKSAGNHFKNRINDGILLGISMPTDE